MPKQIPITPVYDRDDLVEMLDAEYGMLQSHLEDLNEEQLCWKPHPKAHCILDILWHLAYEPKRLLRPKDKKETLARLQAWYEEQRAKAQDQNFLAQSLTWYTGETITQHGLLRGFVVRHLAYHYGQIIALRQTLGVEAGKFYHEE